MMATETTEILRRKVSVASSTVSSIAPEKAEESVKGMETATARLWRDLPAWQQEDNEFIETGYRPASASYRACLKSWGYLHNESVNIFSHLIGAVLFVVLPIGIFSELRSRYDTATTADSIVIGLYFAGVAVCFTLSVAFHTVMCHSADVFHFGIQLDFQGIITLMWGASIPMVYYTFRCETKLQKVYWAIVSLFAVLASIVTFTPQFRKPNTRPLRATVFGSLALSTLLSVIHGVIICGWAEQNRRFPMWGIGLTMLFNSLGAFAYAIKFPERFWRRTFDIFGASHQIMHVMIVLAGLCFVFGCIKAFDNAHSRVTTCNTDLYI